MATNLLTNLLERYASGQQPPQGDVQQHFEQAAQAVPPGSLADALATAFRSSETPPFEQMISQLFTHSNPDQKAGVLNQLLGVLPSGMLSSILPGLGLGTGTKEVTAEDAARVSPQYVENVAKQAQQHDPTIVERASQFYAQHPTVVKMLGAAALTTVMTHLANNQRR